MTNEQRIKRIEKLKAEINAIMGRGRRYGKGQKIHLSKQSILRIKQMEKSIQKHIGKLGIKIKTVSND